MHMRRPGQHRPSLRRSELAQALAACRGTFIATALMSGMSNILMLTGAIFMLEIYDRVLPSRSVPTLVALIIVATGLYGALGVLDLIRGRILVRIGGRLDETISERIYDGLRPITAQGRTSRRRLTVACAISIACARFFQDRDLSRSSTCPGFRST